eukprot:6046155-Prymnesium_polylepis.2
MTYAKPCDLRKGTGSAPLSNSPTTHAKRVTWSPAEISASTSAPCTREAPAQGKVHVIALQVIPGAGGGSLAGELAG